MKRFSVRVRRRAWGKGWKSGAALSLLWTQVCVVACRIHEPSGGDARSVGLSPQEHVVGRDRLGPRFSLWVLVGPRTRYSSWARPPAPRCVNGRAVARVRVEGGQALADERDGHVATNE